MRNNDEHKERRKLLAPAFSTSSFLDSEPLIHNSVRELLEMIKNRDGKPLDVFFWFKMLSLDIAGLYFLSMCRKFSSYLILMSCR